MPEYVAALTELTATQEHISESVGRLAKALVRASQEQDTRSRQRFTLVYRILAVIAIGGLLIATFLVIRQQRQIDTMNVVVGQQQEQLDNQRAAAQRRDEQFELQRLVGLCSERLNAAFFSAVAHGLGTPPGSPDRERATAEFEHIGNLYSHIDTICYTDHPDPTPLDAPVEN